MDDAIPRIALPSREAFCREVGIVLGGYYPEMGKRV